LRLPLLALLIFAVAILAFASRRFWLWAIVRYLESRSMAAWRALIAHYIAGRVPLDSAAAKYNQIESRVHRYAVLAMRLRPGGPSYLKSLSLTPPGCRDDDPRLHALTERASLLHFGPEMFAKIRGSWRQQAESGSSEPDGAP